MVWIRNAFAQSLRVSEEKLRRPRKCKQMDLRMGDCLA